MKSLIFIFFIAEFFLILHTAYSGSAQLDEISRKVNLASRKVDVVLRELNGLKASLEFLQTSNDRHWEELHKKFFQSEASDVRNSIATEKCREICRVPGEQTLHLQKSGKDLKVLCYRDRYLVIMQRHDGSIEFNKKNWQHYKNGFGEIKENREFFIGLQNLHDITTDGDRFELKIELEDFNGVKSYAKYSDFSIGSENDSFKLDNLGLYSGTAGDSFSYHQGQKFTTLDRDNDDKKIGSCGEQFNSAGWFKSCMEANLLGRYHNNQTAPLQEGMYWETFRGPEYSLKKVKMFIRAIC